MAFLAVLSQFECVSYAGTQAFSIGLKSGGSGPSVAGSTFVIGSQSANLPAV